MPRRYKRPYKSNRSRRAPKRRKVARRKTMYGHGRPRVNRLPSGRGSIAGIFSPEIFANLVVIDNLRDRLLAIAPLGSANLLTSSAGADVTCAPLTDIGIKARSVLPLAVFRLNVCRDWVHSVPAPWDAIFNSADSWACPSGQEIDLNQTYANTVNTWQVFDESFRGLINGQPTFSVLECGPDGDNMVNGGWFKPSSGLASTMLHNTGSSSQTRGNFVPYPGFMPIGYVKLAMVYSRCLVYRTKCSFTLMNICQISGSDFVNVKNIPDLRLGKLPDDSNNGGYTKPVPNFYSHIQSTGASQTITIPFLDNAAVPTGTAPGPYFDQPGTAGNWTRALSEGYYAPIGMAQYGGTRAVTVGATRIANIIMTSNPTKDDPRYIIFGVTVRKNFTGARQNSDQIADLTNGLPEYPGALPTTIEDLALGSETKMLIMNISSSAPAATIDLDVDVKTWLGTSSLNDQQHGFYCQYPSSTASDNPVGSGKRYYYPLQGLYAIPWVSPIIKHGNLFQQVIHGVSPYRSFPNISGTQMAVPKGGLQNITGYTNFFSLQTKAQFFCKFYGQRNLTQTVATTDAGGVGTMNMQIADAV